VIAAAAGLFEELRVESMRNQRRFILSGVVDLVDAHAMVGKGRA